MMRLGRIELTVWQPTKSGACRPRSRVRVRRGIGRGEGDVEDEADRDFGKLAIGEGLLMAFAAVCDDDRCKTLVDGHVLLERCALGTEVHLGGPSRTA